MGHAAKPIEQPILWLGVVGFDPQHRARIESLLSQHEPGWPIWRAGPLGEADAWFVNGAHIRVLPDGNLRVAAGLPSERALNLNMGEVDRPIAFSTPFGSSQFEPRCTFDLESEHSVRECLRQFEGWLRALRLQFVLGSQIIERSAELKRGVFHVSRNGNLLAILDFIHGTLALSQKALPADLWDATWDKRPPSASYFPENFELYTPNELAWVYVRRTERDLLPEQYRFRKIYFRHSPRVPMRWLNDAQLVLLRELSTEPGDMQSLSQRTGLPQDRLANALCCLYYAGAVTTTRSRAANPAAFRGDRHDSHASNSMGPEVDALFSYGYSDPRSLSQNDLTAPASLEHRPPKSK